MKVHPILWYLLGISVNANGTMTILFMQITDESNMKQIETNINDK